MDGFSMVQNSWATTSSFGCRLVVGRVDSHAYTRKAAGKYHFVSTYISCLHTTRAIEYSATGQRCSLKTQRNPSISSHVWTLLVHIINESWRNLGSKRGPLGRVQRVWNERRVGGESQTLAMKSERIYE